MCAPKIGLRRAHSALLKGSLSELDQIELQPSVDNPAVHAIGWPHDRRAVVANANGTAHDRRAASRGAPSMICAFSADNSIGF